MTGASVRFRARIARTGTQIYSDGPEYRDQTEVFHVASLATLDGVRVTVGHTDMRPVGHVVPGSHGRVTGPDGEQYLTAELQIDCAATVARIRAGELKGLSCGYNCEHVMRDGRKHQTQIRFDHCALLQTGREQPRCGEHCAVHDRKDNQTMTVRVTDAIQLDAEACSCSTKDRQDERDRIDAWLDIASENHNVHRSAILAEAARVHGDQVHITKELIRDAAQRLSTPGSYTIDGTRQDAIFHVPNRADFVQRTDLNDDETFRNHLARQARGNSTTDASDTDLATFKGDAAVTADSLNDDETFSNHLAAMVKGDR